jgi:AcrR family transcriptional regulator
MVTLTIDFFYYDSAMSGKHPTREALIATVVSLMDSQPIESLTSELVLEKSKISRGSMYHHFQDFSELIEEAQVRRYASYVDQSIVLLSSIVHDVKNREELVEQVRRVTVITQSDGVRENRLERLVALGSAVRSPRMKAILGVEQERLTEMIADLYREVLNKGWGNPSLDPRTIGVLIQAYTLGKVVDDVTVAQMDGDKWVHLINTILETVLFPAP